MFEKTNIRNTTHGISIDEHKKPQVNENLPLVSGSPQINFKDHFGALWNQDESIEGSTRKNTVLFPDDQTSLNKEFTFKGSNDSIIDVDEENTFNPGDAKFMIQIDYKKYIPAQKFLDMTLPMPKNFNEITPKCEDERPNFNFQVYR